MTKKTKSLILFLVVANLFYACRTNEIRDVKIIAEHCVNGLFDEDELGTDCGGNCDDCEKQFAACAVNLNKLDITNSLYGNSSEQITSVTSSVNTTTNTYSITVESRNYRILFSFKGKPDLSLDYLIEDEDKLTIQILRNPYYSPYQVILRNVAINYNKTTSNYEFTFCGIEYPTIQNTNYKNIINLSFNLNQF